LGLMLVALALTMSPAPFHQLVGDGNNSPASLRHVTRMAGAALLPFALGLGLDVFVAIEQVAGSPAAIAGGIVAFVLATMFWYGLAWVQKREESYRRHEEVMRRVEKDKEAQEAELKDKINFAITEARVVLPGAQALLGFQFLTMLTEAFDKLPTELKYLHLGSLGAIAVSTILLIAPAAFHRMAERGENTERVHSFASRMVLAAMSFLALGIVGDLFVVVWKVTGSTTVAWVSSIFALVFFYGLWFGYSLYRRNRGGAHTQSAPAEAQKRSTA
ncbi:MAG: DUF677 domain-containing protein, partial [Chloroflexota bacterium]|nr:DUF677 domain-containing protein [Chloroflexota bacterium]